MTGFVLVSSIIISAGSLALVYFESGLSDFGRWVLIVGAAWLIAQWRGWKWFSYIGLSLAFLLAAAGLWFGLTPGWMFSGALFALVAWDLTDFRDRMHFVAADDSARFGTPAHDAHQSACAGRNDACIDYDDRARGIFN